MKWRGENWGAACRSQLQQPNNLQSRGHHSCSKKLQICWLKRFIKIFNLLESLRLIPLRDQTTESY